MNNPTNFLCDSVNEDRMKSEHFRFAKYKLFSTCAIKYSAKRKIQYSKPGLTETIVEKKYRHYIVQEINELGGKERAKYFDHYNNIIKCVKIYSISVVQ